jgi:hypothetical protein
MIPQSFIPGGDVAVMPDTTWRCREPQRMSGADNIREQAQRPLNISFDRIAGLEAVRQAIFLILNTERYQTPIYSWNYGVELADLFGQPASFVKPELERRIRDALSQDDRITGVDGFSFESKGKTVHCAFTVHTIFGSYEEAMSPPPAAAW